MSIKTVTVNQIIRTYTVNNITRTVTVTYPQTGAGGGVTSVAVSGSQGINVISGSPITGAGTIVLGVDAATLRSHINVEDGATADQSGAEIKTALESLTGANRLDSSAIKNLSSGDVRQFEHNYHGRVRSMVVTGSSVKFDVTYGWRGDWDDTWFAHNTPLYNDKGFYVNADCRIVAVKFVIQWSSTAAANLRFRLSNWTPNHNSATVTNEGDTNGLKDIELSLDIGSSENNKTHILTATNTDFQSGGNDITIPGGSYIGPHLRIEGSSTANGVYHPCMLSIITEEV